MKNTINPVKKEDLINAINSADFKINLEVSKYDTSENFKNCEVETNDFLFIFDTYISYAYSEDGDGYITPRTWEIEIKSVEVSNLKILDMEGNEVFNFDVSEIESEIEQIADFDLSLIENY